MRLFALHYLDFKSNLFQSKQKNRKPEPAVGVIYF